MGYSNYGTIKKMDDVAWSEYLQLCKVLFSRLHADLGLKLSAADLEDVVAPHGTAAPFAGIATLSTPKLEYSFGNGVVCIRRMVKTGEFNTRSAYTVGFNGDIADEDLQHEAFIVSSDMSDGTCVSVKTLHKPYDIAVKCAMILLAELGGMEAVDCDGNTDDDGKNVWLDAIDWLVKQPGLPNAYPGFMRDQVRQLSLNYRLNMKSMYESQGKLINERSRLYDDNKELKKSLLAHTHVWKQRAYVILVFVVLLGFALGFLCA